MMTMTMTMMMMSTVMVMMTMVMMMVVAVMMMMMMMMVVAVMMMMMRGSIRMMKIKYCSVNVCFSSTRSMLLPPGEWFENKQNNNNNNNSNNNDRIYVAHNIFHNYLKIIYGLHISTLKFVQKMNPWRCESPNAIVSNCWFFLKMKCKTITITRKILII